MKLCRVLLLLALGCVFTNARLLGEPLPECVTRGGLPNFLARAERGETLRVAYLGGSITAQDGWRPKTLALLRRRYPQARFEEINAAIGGTGSDLGVFRLRHDVLEHQPDLLFVEFAVNDGGAAPEQIHRCMEGIVRQTWRARSEADICFVYTLAGNMLESLRDERLPRSQAAMEQVADHYAIPSINLGLDVARREKAGTLVFQGEKPAPATATNTPETRLVFSPDGVHPFPDTGHVLYAEAVERGLALLRPVGKPGLHVLGNPLVADHWEAARLVPLSRAKRSAGWTRIDGTTNRLARNFGGRLTELWRANQPGESLEFRFRGTSAAIYDLVGPDCGQVIVKLDDRPAVTRPRFDAYCTYHRLATLSLGAGLPDAEHTVRLEIHPDQPDKAKILSQRNERIDDPKRYDDRVWYAGAILVVGDVVD